VYLSIKSRHFSEETFTKSQYIVAFQHVFFFQINWKHFAGAATKDRQVGNHNLDLVPLGDICVCSNIEPGTENTLPGGRTLRKNWCPHICIFEQASRGFERSYLDK
jgi:hypothetical protein